jgi:hypothetical protein
MEWLLSSFRVKDLADIRVSCTSDIRVNLPE